MFPAIIAGKVFKLLLPKVLDHAMEVFKLDKILEYDQKYFIWSAFTSAVSIPKCTD